MKSGIISFFLLLHCSLAFGSPIKIIEVHSYTENHICTKPQSNGFEDSLRYTDASINLLPALYMDAKTTNITVEQKQNEARKLLYKIQQENPDYIYLTDDASFEFLAPILKDYKIIASGLNREVGEYKVILDINMSNIFAIEEMFRLDQFYRLIEPVFSTNTVYYLISEEENTISETAKFMEKNYTKEILGKGEIEIIRPSNFKMLEDSLNQLNKKPRGIIVLIAQRLYSAEENRYLSKEEIAKSVVTINKRHLELGGNTEFAKLGIGVCCSPSFYEMGKLAGVNLTNFIRKNKFDGGVTSAPNQLIVNTKRLDQLGLSKIYELNPSLIKDRIEGY